MNSHKGIKGNEENPGKGNGLFQHLNKRKPELDPAMLYALRVML
jgi:hypothetical protein